jgi:hypothetical protein
MVPDLVGQILHFLPLWPSGEAREGNIKTIRRWPQEGAEAAAAATK